MIEPLLQIKGVERINMDTDNRISQLRLDRNEFVGKFPPTIYSKVFNKMNIENLTMYPEYGRLKQKIAQKEKLSVDNILIGNGSDSIIKNIFETYTDVTCRVLLTNPTFAMYPIYCKMHNVWDTISVDYSSLTEFPRDEFLKYIKTPWKIKVAVIVNPNNPTGCAVSNNYLLEVVEEAQKKDTLVVIDEAYYEYYKKTMAKYVNTFDNLIVLRTFSKFYGLAGLRLGYALAHPSVINTLKKVQLSFPASYFAVAFAEEFLDDSYIEVQLYADFMRGATYLINSLDVEGVDYHFGHGNFVLIKCDQKIVDELKKKNVYVKGNFKQDILKEYIRVTLGHKEQMERFFCEFIKARKKCHA